jgi:hypothetical protein
MRPTEQQLKHFHTFGYVVFRQLFNAAEIKRITDEFETVIQTVGGGDQHDGSNRTLIVPTIDHNKYLCTLLDDPRIVGITSAILGSDFNYASGDGNYYSGDTGWHVDGRYPKLFAIKIAFYLDPVTRDTGCLRVIPGSHHPQSPWQQKDMQPSQAEETWGVAPSEVPGQMPLETRPGDLTIFYHDLLHASFGGSKRRRMFTMNMVKHGKTQGDLDRIDNYLKYHCPVAHGFKIGGMYTDLMFDTADDARLKHLTQLQERHALVHPDKTRNRVL